MLVFDRKPSTHPMKAFDLLTSLSATEKRGFEEILQQRKRASLLNLYRLLKKSTKEKLDKEQMYKAAFGEAYNKEKDYLIRNELRLLANELKRYITEREWLNDIEDNPHLENYWYLKALNSRNLLEYYDNDYDAMYKAATDEWQLQIKMDMSLAHINRLNKDLVRTLDVDRMLLATEAYYLDLRQLAALKARVYEQHRLGFEHTQKAVNIASNIHLKPFERLSHIDIGNDAETPLSRYYHHLAMSVMPGEDPIVHMQSALEAIEHIKVPGINIEGFKKVVYNNLCIQLQQKEQYSLAKTYGKRAFELAVKDGIHTGVIFANYLRILLKTADIETARQLFEQYKEQFNKFDGYPGILTALIEGEATIGDPDKALEMLQDLNTREQINFNVNKASLIAVYYRKGEYALAENSLETLAQYYRDKQQSVSESENLSWFYPVRQLVKIKSQDTIKPAALKKLKDHYEAISEDAKGVYRRAVLVQWFLDEIEAMLQQNKHLL